MRVRRQRRLARTVPRTGSVTIQADLIRGFSQLRIITGPVHVVAIETGDTATVHDALHEIVSLHAILVRGAFWEMSEAKLAELVIFELPVVPQV